MPSRPRLLEDSARAPSRHRFVEALVDDLGPVRPAPSSARAVAHWALASGAGVIALLALSEPMRRPPLPALDSGPFALELVLIALAALSAVAAGLELGVPGATAGRRWAVLSLAFAAGGLGVLFWGEAFEPPMRSMLGKRPHCFLETIAASLPPLALALVFLRRRVVRGHAGAGALVGAAAAALPAIAMQLVCLHQADHALRCHFSPILMIAALGAIAGRWVHPRA